MTQSSATPAEPAQIPAPSAPVLMVALALLAVLTFGRATVQHFPYVWDDRATVEASAPRPGGIPSTAVQALWGRIPATDHSNTYRPVTRTDLALDLQLAHLGPRGVHAINLALHVLAVLVFFLLARGILGPGAGALAAALFATHPLAAGAVGYATGRAELLLAVFGLAALLAARQPGKPGSGWAPPLAGLLALLAMLSHEGGVALVLIAPLLVAFAPGARRPAGFREFAAQNAGLWVALVVYLALRIHAHPNALNLSLHPQGRPLYLALSLARLFFYNVLVAVVPLVSLFVAPMVEGGPHGLALMVNTTSPLAAMALPIVLALLAVDIWIFFRNRLLGVGLLWFWLAMLPVLDPSIAAWTGPDRALYFALPGLCLSLGALAAMLWERLPARRAAVLVCAGACVVLGVGLGIERTGLWASEDALAARLAAQHPHSAVAWNELGAAYGREGRRDQALGAFRRAHLADSVNVDAALNLGLAYSQMGLADSAMVALLPVADLAADRPELSLTLAKALAARGDFKAAMGQFTQVLEVDSTSVDAWMGIAELQYKQGAYPQASNALRAAARYAPNDERVSNDLGMVCMAIHDAPGAEAAFRHAILQNPAMVAAHYNLARLKYMQGDFESALPEVDRLVALLPGNPGPVSLRDTVLARMAARGHRPVR